MAELIPIGVLVTLTQNIAFALPAVKVTLYTAAAAPTLQQSIVESFPLNTAVVLDGNNQSELAGGFLRCTSASPTIVLKRV